MNKKAVIMTINDIIEFFTCKFMRCLYIYWILVYIISFIISNILLIPMEGIVPAVVLTSLVLIFLSFILYVCYKDNLDNIRKEEYYEAEKKMYEERKD